MAIRVCLQIVRKGTKYESYRITLPRAIVESHNLRDKDFLLEVRRNKLILTPRKRE